MSSPQQPPHHLPLTAVTTAVTSPEDLHLSAATHLHRQQILRRRSHNMKELSKCYRDHYWGLMEEIRVRYREYMWQYGISPVNEVVGDGDGFVKEEGGDGNGNGNGDGNGNGNGNGNGEGGKCAFNACSVKAMTLTRFCRSHILSDAKQQLYKPCEFSLKSAHAGAIPCGKPVLRSVVPCLCSMHYMKAQQHVVRALRKAGLNITSSNKFAPKFHVIVTEFVREIKERRKNALRANQKRIVPKLEIEN